LSVREILCEDLGRAIDGLKRDGFRLDLIYPADDPQSAVLSRGDETVRVMIAGAPALPDSLSAFVPAFVLTKAGALPGQGRAGMLYRDLISGRLGGRYIASHITIPQGGSVADWVHFHRIAFQIIIVRRGWVRVVYEDQGDPFVMNPGDLVLQPPQIRHRVLESSDGLEVLEIGAPALHATFADHEMELPNGFDAGRKFEGQRFLHHSAANGPWSEWNGGEVKETELASATNGLGSARFIKPGEASQIAFAAHEGELSFGFVLEGYGRLDHTGDHPLGPTDAFAVPPGEAWRLNGMSPDFRLLHVTTAGLN
jgi:quercetin dioxygenase-like cupin family protein